MIRLYRPQAGFYQNSLRQETCRIIFFILRTTQWRQVVAFPIVGAVGYVPFLGWLYQMVTNWGAYKNPEMYSHTVLETWLKSRAVLPLKALRGGVGGSFLVSTGFWWLPASLAVAASLQSLPLTSRGPAMCRSSPLLCSCKDTYIGLRSHSNPGRPHLDEILDVITSRDLTLDLSSGNLATYPIKVFLILQVGLQGLL